MSVISECGSDPIYAMVQRFLQHHQSINEIKDSLKSDMDLPDTLSETDYDKEQFSEVINMLEQCGEYLKNFSENLNAYKKPLKILNLM